MDGRRRTSIHPDPIHTSNARHNFTGHLHLGCFLIGNQLEWHFISTCKRCSPLEGAPSIYALIMQRRVNEVIRMPKATQI